VLSPSYVYLLHLCDAVALVRQLSLFKNRVFRRYTGLLGRETGPSQGPRLRRRPEHRKQTQFRRALLRPDYSHLMLSFVIPVWGILSHK
jgi:hypothetical protein